jgi:hypothetical protein
VPLPRQAEQDFPSLYPDAANSSGGGLGCRIGASLVKVRPLGSVTTKVASFSSFADHPGLCSRTWWRRHRRQQLALIHRSGSP